MSSPRHKKYEDYAGDSCTVVVWDRGVWLHNCVGVKNEDGSPIEEASILFDRKQVKDLRRELKLMLKEMK